MSELFAPYTGAAGGAVDENDGQCLICRALFRPEDLEAVEFGSANANTQSLRLLMPPDHPRADMQSHDEQQNDAASAPEKRYQPTTAFASGGWLSFC